MKDPNNSKGAQLITLAYGDYRSLTNFRERRRRSRSYFRGNPDEYIYDPETNTRMREDEYIEQQNRVPIRLNRVRPVCNNIKGQFRLNKTTRIAFPRNREDTLAGEMMSEGLRYVCDVNTAPEIDADNIVEALISGMWGYKVYYGWNRRLVRDEIKIESIDPDRFFFNANIRDRQLNGLRRLGEIHHLPLDEVIQYFAATRKQAADLRQRFAYAADPWNSYAMSGFAFKDLNDFQTSGDPSLVPIIEYWVYEYDYDNFIHDPADGTYERSDMTPQDVMILNTQRILEAQAIMQQAQAAGLQVDPKEFEPKLVGIDERYTGKWHAYFLTPWGEILQDYESPYWHEQHPYTLGFATLFDGEIWGAVEDIIDPQRLINRITQSIDFMFAAGAKGVLIVPESAIPQDSNLAAIADQWTRFNGVIKLNLKPGAQLPKQITAQAIPPGLFEWMSTLGNDIKEISGVTGAQQGLNPTANTPARLYQQQIEQAQTTTRDLFDNFFAVRKQRDLQICQMIQQYYDETRMIATAGRRADGSKYIEFKPQQVRDIDFDVIITDAPDSPAYREHAEDQLANFLMQNRLTFRQYLQMSPLPQSEAILAMINQTNPLLGDQQMTPEAVAGLQAAAAQGNPDAMALMSQAQ